MIQRVGTNHDAGEGPSGAAQVEERPVLRDRRVLFVDADGSVRGAAHALLDRYRCEVETAHDGGEALCMVRRVPTPYDVIVVDIRLPDMNGYELMVKMQELYLLDGGKPLPLVLMTEFGYDPKHSIVNARKAGLPAWAILFKPFRLDQTPGRRGALYPGAPRGAGSVIPAALLLLAAAGHAAIWTGCVNRTHASGWPHALVKKLDKIEYLVLFLSPTLVAVWLFWVPAESLMPWRVGDCPAFRISENGTVPLVAILARALSFYLPVCWLAAAIVATAFVVRAVRYDVSTVLRYHRRRNLASRRPCTRPTTMPSSACPATRPSLWT